MYSGGMQLLRSCFISFSESRRAYLSLVIMVANDTKQVRSSKRQTKSMLQKVEVKLFI